VVTASAGGPVRSSRSPVAGVVGGSRCGTRGATTTQLAKSRWLSLGRIVPGRAEWGQSPRLQECAGIRRRVAGEVADGTAHPRLWHHADRRIGSRADTPRASVVMQSEDSVALSPPRATIDTVEPGPSVAWLPVG
jgi:hypothetical protein